MQLDDNLLKKISTFTFLIGLISLNILLYTVPYKDFTSISQTQDQDSDYKITGIITKIKETQSNNYQLSIKSQCTESVIVSSNNFYGKLNDSTTITGNFFGTGKTKQFQSNNFRINYNS